MPIISIRKKIGNYTQAVLKFTKLITEAQQREAVTRGRSLLPYRLRYSLFRYLFVAIWLLTNIVLPSGLESLV
ncbi:MAG: hypothetical protein LBL62_00735 [Planctomycetaceae bacterium]|nr:hypothetical protein [Planctomycetaceae bacterium]